ncbi:MAG TPA: hypothetical protein PKK55_04475 [Methanofastidiosum sp.]|jgi:hypothetical protein|nr:hypothetical protein [Methanofastidiosum sp.]
MAYTQNDDLELINEVKTLIDEVIDKVPQKKELCLINLSSLIVFTLGCVIGFELFVFNLFLTSMVLLSIMLLGSFFIIGFLLGVFIEKSDSANRISNLAYLNY